jgi:phosphatidylglycerol---prolipoprotein diacylglyceryl transferase
MQFPVYFQLWGWQIHPHPVFEALAYTLSFRLALRNFRRDSIKTTQRTSIMVGGMAGALIGAKVLVLFQHLNLVWGDLNAFSALVMQGKTVVGGLLGAIVGVEITKHYIGVKQSTGDAFVMPLIMGTIVGRVGCFLTGLSDLTCGTATSLPWGVDFGDGIARHPTQLYEILFLFILLIVIQLRSRYRLNSGDSFKFYTIGYLSFRLLVDFIKPDFYPILGISAIQIACILGLVYYRRSFYDFCRLERS